MIKNISKMVSEGNIPDEMKDLLSNFTSNNSQQDNSSNTSSTPNIDIATILKIKSILEKMNNTEDPRANLLRSLKPYLKDSRKSKVEQYIQLFNMTKVMDILKENGGEMFK